MPLIIFKAKTKYAQNCASLSYSYYNDDFKVSMHQAWPSGWSLVSHMVYVRSYVRSKNNTKTYSKTKDGAWWVTEFTRLVAFILKNTFLTRSILNMVLV